MKRCFDVMGAFFGLMFLAPLLVIVGLLVRFKLGSPVIFRQARPGCRGEPFQFLKFRSMTNARDAKGDLLPDAQRLTVFGKRLRTSSLDELPALWNVLKGEMSLVGPRPLLVRYLPLYNDRQARRHEVKPGVTGWAQIHGRNSISWEEKFELDVWYVDNQSFLLDLKILFMTLPAILMSRGIASAGHVTMPVFTGTPETTDE